MGTITEPMPTTAGSLLRLAPTPAPTEARRFATVLFTDIVGSTGLTLRLGDRRWREVLDAYDHCVARSLDRHAGELVKSTGDGSLALFALPGQAIRCAHAIARALRPVGIEVRCGLHCGEVEVRGTDVAGIAVAIAQRVQAAADPGQVLVSRTVADVVAGNDIDLVDRGEQSLRGIPGSWRLYSVT